ncbi:MAG: Com family DNA-binding transcriptional regulator [Nitrospinae bacterium]|nr:Com family DNA-binding transcriptional regulator [Nitrospinota bacterium]
MGENKYKEDVKNYAFLPVNSVRCGKCNRLLGFFEVAKGEIKCPRCKNIQRVEIKYLQERKGG